MDLEESDELCASQEALEKAIFECGLEIKKLLLPLRRSTDTSPAGSLADGMRVKLPKLDVPKFDGNSVNWRSFWEQFNISIHSRSSLSDSEKLVYLQHSVKDGSAKWVIEGLSRSGAYYSEAIESLKLRYDRPRLIHQTHVRMILEATSVKDGTGKELRCLHDTVQQHLRALRAMGYEPSGAFLTSVLELKLDTTTMFRWRKFSQDLSSVLHYQKLLEFLNLRVQAPEASVSDLKKPPRTDEHPKKSGVPSKHFPLFAAAAPGSSVCTVCTTELLACPQFKALSQDKMSAVTISLSQLSMARTLREAVYLLALLQAMPKGTSHVIASGPKGQPWVRTTTS